MAALTFSVYFEAVDRSADRNIIQQHLQFSLRDQIFEIAARRHSGNAGTCSYIVGGKRSGMGLHEINDGVHGLNVKVFGSVVLRFGFHREHGIQIRLIQGRLLG